MTQPVEGAQSGAGTEGQSATGTTDGNSGAQGQSAQQTVPETVSRAEFDQLRNQLAAADRNKTAAEAKLKELQDAALSEEQKRQRDLEQAQETIKAKDEKIQQLTLDLAFLSDNTHEWHNPKAALALADKSAVTVAEDGTVKGLKEALQAVATQHPYLLKAKAEGEAGQAAAPTGVTGVAGQGASGGGANKRRGDLERRFPQLKGRTS